MSSWSRVQLGDLVDLQSGGTPAKARADFWNGDLPWVSPKDVKVPRLHSTEENVTEIAVGNGTRAVEAGTILLVVRSMILAREVPLTVVQRRMAFNQDIKAIRPRPSIDGGFLWSWLLANRDAILGIVDEAGHGTKRLQTDRFLGLEVSLPPLPTQRRIAAILGAYDDLIEVNRRRIAVLEEMARRLFEEWFVAFRFPGHDTTPLQDTPHGPLPQGWRSGMLGDVLSLEYGRALPASVRVPGGVPVIGSSGIVGWHESPLVHRPGIVVGRKGNVGAITWSPMAFFPIDTVFYVESEWPALFLVHLLRRQSFQNSDAAVPDLNRNAALRMPIGIPPRELAVRFDTLAAPKLAMAEKLGASNERLAAARDLLLPRLISGELTVADAERALETAA